MQQSKYFSVIVGSDPMEVLIGFLDEDGRPKAGYATATVSKAEIAIPNYSEVWGIQVKDAKTKELTGQIEFLDFNDPKGSLIRIRYHRTFNSLDMEYQELKKVNFRDGDAEIYLGIGVNNFDPVKDKKLIEFLKYHYQNGQNESRDPSVAIAFNTYDAEKLTSKRATMIEEKMEVQRFVLDIRFDVEALSVLAGLFGLDPKEQHDILFEDLLELADKPAHFKGIINYHRKQYEALIGNALGIELIDTETPHTIHYRKGGKRTLLLENVEHGEQDILAYVVQNFHKPAINVAMDTLKNAIKDYESLLQ